eukprot:CAMPEP_0168609866 /NCGR_PEP_ID=MMETSP0449_2-20121227/1452_1 /TAXON_ID=1082188 /ORGANISM="Strombidium rassoulzadegani, Strain ras09" /LENGTH=76 /DNA_ID=CAMNT_0008650073 /DNA_START=236 /DNA_END=466 /DNA_ORIENTATION=-
MPDSEVAIDKEVVVAMDRSIGARLALLEVADGALVIVGRIIVPIEPRLDDHGEADAQAEEEGYLAIVLLRGGLDRV